MKGIITMGLATHYGARYAACGTPVIQARRTDDRAKVTCVRCRRQMREKLPRVTPAQLRILEMLESGDSPINHIYDTWTSAGTGAGRVEISMGILADRGLVDWGGAGSDIDITDLGRKVLARHKKGHDQQAPGG